MSCVCLCLGMLKGSPDSALCSLCPVLPMLSLVPAGVPGVDLLPVLAAPVSARQHSALEHQLPLDAAGGAPGHGNHVVYIMSTYNLITMIMETHLMQENGSMDLFNKYFVSL